MRATGWEDYSRGRESGLCGGGGGRGGGGGGGGGGGVEGDSNQTYKLVLALNQETLTPVSTGVSLA